MNEEEIKKLIASMIRECVLYNVTTESIKRSSDGESETIHVIDLNGMKSSLDKHEFYNPGS
jgi:hypothetical protein